MINRNLLYIGLIVVLSFALVFVLQFGNEDQERNGFHRKITKTAFKVDKVIKLPTSLIYFAGSSPEGIYLKDLQESKFIFFVDHSLNAVKPILLKFSSLNARKQRVNMGFQDSLIYVTNNKSGDLNILSTKTGRVSYYKNPVTMFDQSILISPSSIVGREVTRKEDHFQRILTKYHFLSGKIERVYTLEKQVDGFFCTDGLLKYDVGSRNFFYMYFYRGQFVCLDTNLNVVYATKTIDTVRTATIKIAALAGRDERQNKTLTQANPARIVNRNFTINENRLYLLSALKADNESSGDYRGAQVIDVYNIKDGSYLKSFYIPKYKNKKLREIRFHGKSVFAIFDNYLVKFKT